MFTAIVNVLSAFVKKNSVLTAFIGGNITGGSAVYISPKLKKLIKYKLTGKR